MSFKNIDFKKRHQRLFQVGFCSFFFFHCHSHVEAAWWSWCENAKNLLRDLNGISASFPPKQHLTTASGQLAAYLLLSRHVVLSCPVSLGSSRSCSCPVIHDGRDECPMRLLSGQQYQRILPPEDSAEPGTLFLPDCLQLLPS